jgi:hypothetical protein
MKKVLAIVLAATMLLAFALPVSANPDATVDLIADGPDSDYTLIVGEVAVTHDASTITVTYTIDEGDWELVETHVDVQTTAGAIPQNGNANPKVGKFAQSGEWDPLTGDQLTATYTFANPGVGMVVIAAQAVIYSATEIDPDTLELGREESAWANGSQFNVGKNWAMYFTYDASVS